MTTFPNLKAKIEILNPQLKESSYRDIDINLIRFWGGTLRKTSLQIGFKDQHFQLDHENIQQLKKLLNEEF